VFYRFIKQMVLDPNATVHAAAIKKTSFHLIFQEHKGLLNLFVMFPLLIVLDTTFSWLRCLMEPLSWMLLYCL